MRFFSIFNNPFKKSTNIVAIVPTTHDSVINITKIVPARIISDSSLSIIEAHQVEYKEDNNTPIRNTYPYPVASPLLISSEESVTTSIQIENNNQENNNEENNNEENNNQENNNQENNNQENNNQENNNEDNRGRDCRANLFAMIFVLTWFFIAS